MTGVQTCALPILSDIGLNWHYFVYELALKCFFEMKLFRKMINCGDTVRYEDCDWKRKVPSLMALQDVNPPKH